MNFNWNQSKHRRLLIWHFYYLSRFSSGSMLKESATCWRLHQFRALETGWSRSSTASQVSYLKLTWVWVWTVSVFLRLRCSACPVLWTPLCFLQDRRHHAMSFVSEAERLQQSGLSYPETEHFRAFVCTFKSSLEDFLCRAEARGRELQIMVNVCDFCEQVRS